VSPRYPDTPSGRTQDSRDCHVSYRLLVDHSRDPAFVCQHGELQYANAAFAALAGYRRDELTGLAFASIFIPVEGADPLADALGAARRQVGQPSLCETKLLHRDGITRIPVSLRITFLMGGEPAVFAASLSRLEDPVPAGARPPDAVRKYRSMFENSVIGMYQSTPQGCLLDANQALAELLGFGSVGELLRELQHIRDIYADPRDRDALVRELDSLGSMHQRETRWRRRDGRVMWVLENSRAVYGPDGKAQLYEGTVQEVTARKHAEGRLQDSEKRYRALVETSHIGVFLSIGGRCLYANRALAKLIGWTEEGMIGESYHAFYAPECVAEADQRMARRESGKPSPSLVEVALLHKDGKTRINATVHVSTFEQDGAMYTAGTVLDITERKAAERQLVYNATHDVLTGLPNRGFLTERLAQVIARARADGDYDFAVMFLDIDEFKFVNDSFGHAQGDGMLVEVARRLQGCLRQGDVIARHGGDEFTILLENMDSSQDALLMAGRIEAAFGEPVVLESGEASVHASIGITFGRREYTAPEQMLRDADIAMYRAKSSGKACHVVFDAEMHGAVRRRLSLETDLRLGLERDQFRAHYQPIYDLREGRLMGFEALLRWNHPAHGLLSPAGFLDIAEESSLILPIGWWMLEHAALQLSAWRSRYPGAQDLTMSVNISDRQFASPFLIEQVKAVLAASGLPPQALCLEITETVFIGDPQGGIARLDELKGLGVGLHLDDFGTGFSSLSYISTYPVDVLKVDRLFIMGMKGDARRESVLRAIMQLTRELGIQAIAEGIETAEQVQMLKRLGFRRGQGFLLGSAMPAEQAARHVERLGTAPTWHSWLRALTGRIPPSSPPATNE
jgi:diguanylate cyclase (GGDEF)-like protein/PAS domain S-box-containing protein